MIIAGKKKKFLLGLSLLLIFALIGCVSAEKRFEKGLELERKGHFEEAARSYIKALEKEPAWEEARQRLEDAGARAIDIFLNQAYAHRSSEDYEDAVQMLNRVDDLRRHAAKVSVILPVPDDYEDFSSEITAAAVASLFKQAEYSEQAGDWTEAIRTHERLKRNYPLSPSQNQEVDKSRARIYVKWAEQDLAREYYRAAYDHAQNAIDILGTDDVSGISALEIQKAALDAGTRAVAVLPFWFSEIIENEVPRGMERELYDVIIYEYLSEPVLFVAFIDPGRIQRELRRFRTRYEAITRQMATRVGQNLNADFVVTGRIESYEQEENIHEEKEHRVRLRGDPPSYANYLEQRYALKLTAEVKCQIIDSRMRRMIDEISVNTDVKDQFRRGIFDGDYSSLDLSRSELRLFDSEELRRAEQELVDRLIDELAERLADRINDRISKFID